MPPTILLFVFATSVVIIGGLLLALWLLGKWADSFYRTHPGSLIKDPVPRRRTAVAQEFGVFGDIQPWLQDIYTRFDDVRVEDMTQTGLGTAIVVSFLNPAHPDSRYYVWPPRGPITGGIVSTKINKP